MPETLVAPIAPSAQTEVKVIIAGKFAGMLGRFQSDAFGTMHTCGLSREVSHKIATDYGSDLGRLMASNADLSSKIGKADKAGQSRVSIKGGGKITTTYSMSVVRASQQINDLYKEGLLESRELPDLEKSLVKYIDECKTWVKEQTWK